jgi:hypothetical protein
VDVAPGGDEFTVLPASRVYFFTFIFFPIFSPYFVSPFFQWKISGNKE